MVKLSKFTECWAHSKLSSGKINMNIIQQKVTFEGTKFFCDEIKKDGFLV